MVFNIFKKNHEGTLPEWRLISDDDGIRLRHAGDGEPLMAAQLSGFIAQLIDDGFAHEYEGGIDLGWDGFYEALRHPDYVDLTAVLGLPDFTDKVPSLCSQGSLSDTHFSIAIDGWALPGGRPVSVAVCGGLLSKGGQVELMRPEHWSLYAEVVGFARRGDELREARYHGLAWGRIRSLALKAGSRLDDFLGRSVVLTPERLQLRLRKSRPTDGDTVVEIAPDFEGAPPDWLERFDAYPSVPDQYNLPTERGIVQVLITPQVRTVLREIKRLPGRRMAGPRAEAFVLNPYAALGEDARDVIDEAQFAKAREDAGLVYERFAPLIEHDAYGYPTKVGLLIESADSGGLASSETRWLSDEELEGFVRRLEAALSGQHPLLAWEGYDLELQGDAQMSMEALRVALGQHRAPRLLVSWEQVYDLSAYSKRIEGIGEEKTYYSPYIAKKKDEEGWFPDNVAPYVAFTPEGEAEPVLFPLDKKSLDKLRALADEGRALNKGSLVFPGLPKPVSLAEAEDILSTFCRAEADIEKGRFHAEKRLAASPERDKSKPRKTLVLRSNIQHLDYEIRRKALQDFAGEPEHPGSLKREHSMLPHQRKGLAWLQHLFKSQIDFNVGGCVLADDMGLGKTFQLLAFMAWVVETQPEAAPILVVAPVSLLENWREEVDKFLEPGVLPMLVAYGNGLAPLRVPRQAVDERLRTEDGLVNFLKPNWVGRAKLVLTTYETLRDLEFSFAAQTWSVMVCDEAQKIKNPAAMVTRAAKKQNAAFKIACTGTPVENTLADLWCLFDFVQPGLLGALDEFGKRYRKPIEAHTEDERKHVEELRERIAPQILRRIKADVAQDLPQKIIDPGCRYLKISVAQRSLYAKAVDDFKKRDTSGAVVPFKNHLGLLHYLRLICTDPRPYGLTAAVGETLAAYRAKTPKLDWLIRQLQHIRDKDEKAIVFCEFRDIQRLLQHYIEIGFGLKADIINGDTSAAAECDDNRQRRIKAFQSKPGFDVIILSPLAVGFGVNIQAANHVVHYTRTWNPAKEDQATDRSYRIGQTREVHVYYPVVRAEDFTTFDVKLDQLLEYKRALATDMLNGSGDLGTRDFDIGELVPAGDASQINPRIDIDKTNELSGRYFEGLIAALWSKQGLEYVLCTPASGDQGVDVIAISGKRGVLIQTKVSSNDAIRLGWDTVKEVVGGEAYYRHRYPNVEFMKFGLTNRYFNATAHEHAELNDVMLIERPKLQVLLEQYPITLADVEHQLHGMSG